MSVALSSDATTALVGGANDNAKVGAVWVFSDRLGPEEPAEEPPAEEPPAEEPPLGETPPAQPPAPPLLNSSDLTVENVVPSSGILSNTAVLLADPRLGLTGNLAPFSGSVLVKLPGSGTFVPLTGLRQVPFGTIIDARHGTVTVTTMSAHGVLQTLNLSGGEFELNQRHNGLVVADLVGGSFKACPTARERGTIASTSSTHVSAKHVVRKLWASGHGNYATKGNYASGAVLGTRWLTEDLCDGTLIRVATDKVLVTNLLTHRRLVVKAGHSYFAKAP